MKIKTFWKPQASTYINPPLPPLPPAPDIANSVADMEQDASPSAAPSGRFQMIAWLNPLFFSLLAGISLMACAGPEAASPAANRPERVTPSPNVPANSFPQAAPPVRTQVDISNFDARYQAQGQNPEAVAHLWFEGIYTYLEPSTRAQGAAMLERVMATPNWQSNDELLIFRESLARRPYIFYSYDKAASPGSGYRIDTSDFELSIVGSTALEGDRHRLMLKSMGTDTPRAVIFNKGANHLWEVAEFPRIYNGIEPPPSDPPRLIT